MFKIAGFVFYNSDSATSVNSVTPLIPLPMVVYTQGMTAFTQFVSLICRVAYHRVASRGNTLTTPASHIIASLTVNFPQRDWDLGYFGREDSVQLTP